MKENSINLLPKLNSGEWVCWSPRPELSPVFEFEPSNGVPVLKMNSNGKSNSYGKWICNISDIDEGQAYHIGVEFRTENIEFGKVNLHAVATWRGSNGKPLVRDYIDKHKSLEDVWQLLYRTVEAPKGATGLTLELVFKWSDRGAVTWRNAKLIKTAPVAHRSIKVVSAYTSFPGTQEENLEAVVSLLDKAGKISPDVICLGETVLSCNIHGKPAKDLAVSLNGKEIGRIAEKAKKYNAYVVLSVLEKEEDSLFNTGLLINRSGEIAGCYRKVHLPLCEGEDGVTPGSDYPVFETDFGRVGIMICWDQAFPETARILAAKGAEVIFVPSNWSPEIQARARAVDNGVYVVVSGPAWEPKPCRIINTEGTVICEVQKNDKKEDGFCTAVLDLDQRHYTYWLSVGEAYGEGKSIYMQERRPDTYDPVHADL